MIEVGTGLGVEPVGLCVVGVLDLDGEEVAETEVEACTATGDGVKLDGLPILVDSGIAGRSIVLQVCDTANSCEHVGIQETGLVSEDVADVDGSIKSDLCELEVVDAVVSKATLALPSGDVCAEAEYGADLVTQVESRGGRDELGIENAVGLPYSIRSTTLEAKGKARIKRILSE